MNCTTAMRFVDTNVLLYAQDPRAPDKQQRASGWLAGCWQRGCGRISTQVLNELYANLRRAAPSLAVADCRALVRRYRAGFPPARFQRKVSDLIPTSLSPFPSFLGAIDVTEARW